MTQQLITGNEKMFQNISLTQKEINVINQSQTLVSELLQYNSAVLQGTVNPIQNNSDFQGISWNPNPSVNAIVFGTYGGSNGASGLSATTFVGTLAHEIGHYINNASDLALQQQYATQLATDSNFAAWDGLHQEGEAVYNNFIVYQEILSASGGDTSIDVSGGYIAPAGTPLLSVLNTLYNQGVANGISAATLKNLIIDTAGGYYASLSTSTTGQTYWNFYGTAWGAPAPKALPAPIESISLATDPNTGLASSITETLTSGLTETINFNSNLDFTSTLFGPNGQMEAIAAYSSTDVETGTVSTDSQGDTTLQFEGGSVLLGASGQEISQVVGGALSVAIGPGGNAQLSLSTGDSTGTSIAFSGVESMTLNLDGSYSIVDQSGNAYTLAPVADTPNYTLSNSTSTSTFDLTLDASALSSVQLGQTVALQTTSGASLTLPYWGGSSVIETGNLGSLSVAQGAAVTIGTNTVDVSDPGSGTTQQYVFSTSGAVDSIATFDDSSAATSPVTRTSYDTNGAQTQELVNNTDGTSQVWSWNAADPSADYLSEVANYSGQDGTGTLLSETTDYTDGMSEVDSYGTSSGVLVTRTVYSDLDGEGVVLSQTTNYANGTSTVTTYASAETDGDDGLSEGGVTAVTVTYSGADGTGTVQGTTYATANNGAISGAQIGNVLGSQIGKILGGNSLVESIGLSSVLGGIGEDVGQAIDAADTVGEAGDISETVSSIADGALSDIATTGAGAVGTYLAAEFVKDLGITGLPAQVLDTGAGYVVGTIASNLAAEAAGEDVAWDAGMSWTSFEGGLAGFAGTELASLSVSWSTPEEADLASVGGALGGLLGSYWGPFGSFIGGFVGDLLGGALGSLFGDDYKPDPEGSGIWTIYPSYSTPFVWTQGDAYWGAGLAAYANAIGNAAMSELNTIVGEAGGIIANAKAMNAVEFSEAGDIIPWNAVVVDVPTQTIRTYTNSTYASFSISDSSDAIDWIVFNELSEIQFSGGDPYIERAIAATVDERATSGGSVNLESLAGNIAIAQDYEKYLANENTINGLIAQDPTSNFSIGWILELEQAATLDLEYGSTSATYTSPVSTLKLNGQTIYNQAENVIDGLIDAATGRGASNVTLSGTGLSLTLEAPNSLSMQESGDNNHVLIGGNGSSITLNGNYDLLSVSGNGNSVIENGNSGTLSVYGDNNSAAANGQYVSILLSGTGNSLTNGNGYVTLADSSSATINGISENISLWNHASLTANGGEMLINAGGNSSSVTVNGDNAIVNLGGDDNSFTGNGQGEEVSAYGTGEVVTLGGGSVSLGDGAAATVNGENAGVTVGNQNALTVNGQDIGVAVSGNGDGVILNGNSLGVSGSSSESAFTMNGSNDSISIAGSNNSLTGNGNGDYMTVAGSGNSLVANGQGVTITLAGSLNVATVANGTAIFQNGASGTVNGGSDAVTIYNTSTVSINGSDMVFTANGSNNTATLNGDDVQVSASGASNVLTDNGSYISVNASGDADSITENGDHEWVTVNGSYDAVGGQMNDTTVTINGTGGSIIATGSNNLLVENGQNDYLTVNGYNNTLDANGSQITAALSGTGNTVSIASGTVSLSDNAGTTINGYADQINIRNTSQVEVDGSVMSLAINGSLDTVTANGSGSSLDVEGSSNLITGNGGGDSLSANGNYNDIALNGNGESVYVNGTDNVLMINGQGNTVSLAGTNDTLHAAGATAYVLDNSSADFEGAGDAITVYNNDNVTVNGSGFTLSETATDSQVTANGDYNSATIGGNHNSLALNGNGDSVQLSGSSNSVTVSGADSTLSVSGVQQTVALNEGTVDIADGSQVNVVGNGSILALGTYDTLTVNGSNNWVSAGEDDVVTLNGSGNGVGGSASGITAVMQGNGQYAMLNGAAINAGGGISVSVTGNDNSITVGAGSTLQLSGSGDSVQMSGGTLQLAAQEASAGSDPETGSTESGFAINGFDFTSYNAGEFSSAAGDQSLGTLAATGANSISLVVTQYVQNVTDTDIEPSGATESDAGLEQAISEAEARGLTVTLKPHLDVADGTWRAFLAPSDVGQFFANYQAMIVHYAEIAQATGVGTLVIGTEMESLSGMAYEPYWDTLIAAVRQVYSGQLTYASGWNETANVSFWDKLDIIGADAYIPVTSETDPTLQQLETGWTTVSSDSYAASVMENMSPLAFYESMSAEYDKPVLFTEIGYQSINDTNQLEGAFGTSNWVDYQQQSQALQAFFETFSQNGGNWFEGAYLWNWEANPAGVEAGDFSVQGKPALNIVDYWYGQQTGAASGSATPDTLTGDSNSVWVGNGSALDVVGDSNVITLGANSAVNVNGQDNTVQVTGGNNLIQTTGATTISLGGTGTTAITDGDGDTISASGSQDGLAVSSNASTVTLSGANDALSISGSGSTINVSGAGDTVSVAGTGNSINVSGSAAVIQTNAASTIALQGDASSATVEGGGNTISVTGTNDSVTVAGSGAVLTIGDGGSSVQLDSGNYQITAGNGSNAITAGDGTNVITVGSGSNSIAAGNGTNTVTLGGGTDTVTLGSGADSVTLGNGSDTITLGGNDTLMVNVEAGDSANASSALVTEGSSAASQTNELVFSGANSDQLWFSRSNNDLLVSVIGTSSEIDVAGWFSGSGEALQTFAAADGKLLTADDVNALVSAMASFTAPPAGATALPDSYQSQLQPVIAANWH